LRGLPACVGFQIRGLPGIIQLVAASGEGATGAISGQQRRLSRGGSSELPLISLTSSHRRRPGAGFKWKRLWGRGRWYVWCVKHKAPSHIELAPPLLLFSCPSFSAPFCPLQSPLPQHALKNPKHVIVTAIYTRIPKRCIHNMEPLLRIRTAI
jgi:hypothetical protein